MGRGGYRILQKQNETLQTRQTLMGSSKKKNSWEQCLIYRSLHYSNS